jgi:hypothetical protein
VWPDGVKSQKTSVIDTTVETFLKTAVFDSTQAVYYFKLLKQSAEEKAVFRESINSEFRLNFNNLPNPSAALGPGVYPASNRNEYQRHKNCSGE